jgi:ergothioneine biosynthesis protein EgtB
MAAVEAATQADLRAPESLSVAYRRVRSLTTGLCEPLRPEDFVVQSMPDASPAKWHLAHTTWFFEQFLLKSYLPGYRAFNPQYEYLFNSYYESLGPMHPRAERGMLTRPGVNEIYDYREHVDAHMAKLIDTRADDDRVSSLSILGLNHEQQHQELLLTDIKHLFSRNPLLPAYRASTAAACATPPSSTLRFLEIEGGIREIGATGKHFCFDNETPRHRTLVEPFALADRPVVNGEYREFIRAGGYRRPEFWLSDGWAIVKGDRWMRPLYWSESLDTEFTLAGEQALHPNAPVCHLSYYEADAFARWAGARLPSEAEWEVAAAGMPLAGNLLNNEQLHPRPPSDAPGLKQLFGDVWEWTASAYGPYPGFRAAQGALGEYNGKFMCNQLVLRGGSCVTPIDHIRATYRNFFYPHARWQFTGLRLAKDL